MRGQALKNLFEYGGSTSAFPRVRNRRAFAIARNLLSDSPSPQAIRAWNEAGKQVDAQLIENVLSYLKFLKDQPVENLDELSEIDLRKQVHAESLWFRRTPVSALRVALISVYESKPEDWKPSISELAQELGNLNDSCPSEETIRKAVRDMGLPLEGKRGPKGPRISH